jgi:hypothetical protein
MRRIPLLTALVFCLATVARAQTKEITVPAGTLLQCTVDEPNFSSRTAHVGDPLLCHVRSLTMFGHSVFPRGAYLSGRLEEFRDPGHFYGKGWLRVEFVSLTVPGGTFPLSSKIVSAPHYRVDADGNIRGRGHARRDAVEWLIPIMWPEKALTLPARGPRPALHGETPLLLRVLDDLSIPADAVITASTTLSSSTREPLAPAPSQSASAPPSSAPASAPPSAPVSVPLGATSSTNFGANSERPSTLPRFVYGGTSIPAAEPDPPLFGLGFRSNTWRTNPSALNLQTERPVRASRTTLLILKDGRSYVTTNYWLDGGQIVYVDSDGAQEALLLEDLDFQSTAKLNRERGMTFTIRSKPTER